MSPKYYQRNDAGVTIKPVESKCCQTHMENEDSQFLASVVKGLDFVTMPCTKPTLYFQILTFCKMLIVNL